jgi:hypothetical protein
MSNLCVACNCEIPEERLEALPNTDRCVKCSNAKPFKGYMVFAHKTAPEIVCVSMNNPEAIRIADRANARSR